MNVGCTCYLYGNFLSISPLEPCRLCIFCMFSQGSLVFDGRCKTQLIIPSSGLQVSVWDHNVRHFNPCDTDPKARSTILKKLSPSLATQNTTLRCMHGKIQ